MKDIMTDQDIISISNAMINLYRVIVLVEDTSSFCHVYEWEKELSYLAVNDGDPFAVLCDNIYRNIHPEDREEFKFLSDPDRIHEVLSKQIQIYGECRIRHEDGNYYWYGITICNAKARESAKGQEYLFLIQDIHESKSREVSENAQLLKTLCKLENEYHTLFEENMTDSLTGCYNRKGFKYYETFALEEAKKADKKLFVCVLDLNGLKYLNDTYGHEAGDTGIRTVADALRASVPEVARIIRTGGDELLVFAALDSDSSEPEEMGRRLEEYLDNYNKTHDNPFRVSASYGYVFEDIDENVDSLEKYIQTADEKMYEMKEKTDPYKR